MADVSRRSNPSDTPEDLRRDKRLAAIAAWLIKEAYEVIDAVQTLKDDDALMDEVLDVVGCVAVLFDETQLHSSAWHVAYARWRQKQASRGRLDLGIGRIFSALLCTQGKMPTIDL